MDQSKHLVIADSAGRVLAVARENRKGFTKTLENGRLWALHDDTGRLLPFYDDRPATIEDRGDFYVATVGGDAPHGASAPREAGASTTPGASPDSGLGSVLDALAGVIARRHAELPEGSYTTHLFESGGEKIRKKTGEEAIELILASERTTMVSEGADLLYHLLVLLESEGIPLCELAAELRSR